MQPELVLLPVIPVGAPGDPGLYLLKGKLDRLLDKLVVEKGHVELRQAPGQLCHVAPRHVLGKHPLDTRLDLLTGGGSLLQ